MKTKKNETNYKETQVFTPEWVTKEMLQLLNKDAWKDHKTYLFEPSCGSGDMLVVCLDDIFDQLTEKYEGDKAKAVAETLFKFFAVEIDPDMVFICRKRVYRWFKERSEGMDSYILLSYIFAHALQDRIRCDDFFNFTKQDSIDKIKLMK